MVRTKGLKKPPQDDGEKGLSIAKRENAKKVFGWFDKHYNGATSLLFAQFKDKEGNFSNSGIEEDLKELIGSNLSHWIISCIRSGSAPLVKYEDSIAFSQAFHSVSSIPDIFSAYCS